MDFVNVNDQIVNIAQVIRKCPGATLRRSYTRAMREWCQQTQWLRLNVPGVTAAGVQVYNLGDDDNLDVIGVRAVSLTDTAPNGAQTVNALQPVDSTRISPNAGPGAPRGFGFLPTGQLALYPVPDGVYDMTITLIVVPRESGAADAQVPRAPLMKYSNDIEAGALAYLQSLPGMPWTDKTALAMNQRAFEAGIANGKADVQRAFNVGSMRVRPRRFLV